jgi:uncharacterized protein (DUF488 family)
MIMPPTQKEKPDGSLNEDPNWASDQRERGYYYDDAHGYETFIPGKDIVIYTIGHSTREFPELVDLLRENEIELVADVRSFPGSRKFPQYNKEDLMESFPAVGIEYRHLRGLGGRRSVRKDSENTVWRNKAFQGYADYMETIEFADGIKELLDIAEDETTAIMCSEAVWWRCHRSMISDYLKASGIEVLHIMEGGKVSEHPYTSAAKLVDGRLVYGPAVEGS